MDRETEIRIANADAHADYEWRDAAARSVINVGVQLGEFTVDDVWHALRHDYPHVWTHEPRAIGGILRSLARAQRITKTGRFEESKQKPGKGVAVWRFNG